MPVYEYKAVEKGCAFCQSKFEVKQEMKKAPLKNCPKCGTVVKRLISPPSILMPKPLSAIDSVRERIAGNIPAEKTE